MTNPPAHTLVGALLKERRFECQCCGVCCSQRGNIYPSEQNIKDLATFLDMSDYLFVLRYLQEIYDPSCDAYLLAYKSNKPEDNRNGCLFHFNTHCAIYNGPRADCCLIFPWNHFDLEKGEWLNSIITHNHFWCPGIGKGPEFPIKEIARLKEKYNNLGIGFHRRLNLEDSYKVVSTNQPAFQNPLALPATPADSDSQPGQNISPSAKIPCD